MATTWMTHLTEALTDEAGDYTIQANSAMLVACLVSEMSESDKGQVNVLQICRTTTSLLGSGSAHVRGRVAQCLALLAGL